MAAIEKEFAKHRKKKKELKILEEMQEKIEANKVSFFVRKIKKRRLHPLRVTFKKRIKRGWLV